MKLIKCAFKLAAAVAAIAGIAYLVNKHMDEIRAWLAKFCPCCAELEEDFVPDEVTEEEAAQVTEDAPAAQAPAEEAVPVEETPAEEAPVENSPAEEAPAADSVPVADEADFAEE